MGNKQNLILFVLQPNTRVVSPNHNLYSFLPFHLPIHYSPK